MLYPKISIVTPSFNQGKYIEQTILSIINQGYPNLEYIIIDGGSTDETIEIINKYQAHITYWISESDKGQSDALNKGLAKCTGEIFNWINSDDYLEPGALERVAMAFNDHTDIVCGYCRIFNHLDNATIQLHRTEIFATVEESFIEKKINQPAMWYRLSVIKKLGGVNASLHYIMDLELFWKYLTSYGLNRIKTVENTLAHFRIHDASKTGVYEERFRQEESAVLYTVLSQQEFGAAWINLFTFSAKYKESGWQFIAIQKDILKTEIAKYFLYTAFAKGNFSFARAAYLQLAKKRKLKLNLQNVAMFVKLFIGDIPLRRYKNVHA